MCLLGGGGVTDIDKDFAWLRFHIRKLPQWMEADTLSKRIEFEYDKLALEVDELRLEVAECHDDLRATRSVSVALEIAQSRVQELEGAMDEQDRIHDERFSRIAELEAGLRKIGNQYPSARLENAWNRSARRIARRVLEGKA